MVGNASSVHGPGRQARRFVDQARQQIATLVSAPSATVVFTGSGSEANNQALASVDGLILTSTIEHESVLNACRARQSTSIDAIPVGGDGMIDLRALEQTLDQLATPAALLSIMLANNETGAIQPIHDVARLTADRGLLLHVDAVQAAGKIPIDLAELGADFLTLSAHKFGGPQGVGALIARPGLEPRALLKGGAQEQRFRAGTENVAGIVGFGLAAELAIADTTFKARVQGIRDRIEAEILAMAPDARVFGAGAPRLPNTSCLTMPGVSHETQLIAFDLAGLAVSSGAACSSGKVGPSHVLAAMGISDSEAATAIRVSLGWASSTADADRFIKAYGDLFQRNRARMTSF